MAEIIEKVSLDPCNFRITTLSARKSEQMKNFQGIKICLSGFDLYSLWVPMIDRHTNLKHSLNTNKEVFFCFHLLGEPDKHRFSTKG